MISRLRDFSPVAWPVAALAATAAFGAPEPATAPVPPAASAPQPETAPPPSPAVPVALTADLPLEIDGRTRQAVARGNARLAYGEWTLVADEIRYSQAAAEAWATGSVVATRPGWRILGDSIHYDLLHQRIEVTGFRFGQPPFHASGDRAFGTAETMTFQNVHLFYGEPGLLTPRGSARVLRVYRDERMEAEGLRVAIGPLPAFSVSGIARPLEIPRLQLETRAGFDSSLGLQLGASVYLPTPPGLAPGGTLDVFSKRGVLAGPGLRYDIDRGGGTLRGGTEIAYIRDGGDRREDTLGRPIDADRYYWTWEHRQRWDDRWTLVGELGLWSDSAVIRDFRERWFDRKQEPDSFLEGSLELGPSILSAFTRIRPNDFQVVAERLPEIRWDLLPTPLAATGALLEVRASAAMLREKPLLDGAPSLRSDRIDVYAGLGRTLVPAQGITFTPVAGGRFTCYGRGTEGAGGTTRWLGEVGFDARLHAARVSELEKPVWGIDGLRHIVEPRIEYRYVPEASSGPAFIPGIDRPAFFTQMQPLGLADRRDIDTLGALHVMRLGLKNIVETRRSGYGSRRLLQVDMAVDWDLDPAAGERDFSDIQAEMILTPADWLDWWLLVRVDPENPNLSELDTRFTITNGEAWSLGFGVDFLRNDIEQYQLVGRCALSEAAEVFGAVRYDAREDRFNEVLAGLETRLSQVWALRTGVSFRDGPRRESGFGLRLDLRFLRF